MSGSTRVMLALADDVEYWGDWGMKVSYGPGPVGSRKGKPGMVNSKWSSGLEATVGDQGTTGDEARDTGGYWRRGLLGLG